MHDTRLFAIPRAAALAGAIGLSLAAAAPALGAEDFDLDALIAAARNEPPIQVYDSTGKIVEMAKSFTAKYGVEATGRKVSADDQLDLIIREARAGNIQGDVALLTDTPAAVAQLLPEKFVFSWLPPDMAEKIPARYQNPLAMTTNASVWAYNTEVYSECPIRNLWDLTKPEWRGRVAFYDPLKKGTYPDWFNQMEIHADDLMRAAYEEAFGKPLETDLDSATKAWVKAFAQNGPLVAPGDDEIAEAVGAPGQKEPFFGLMSSAKFRDNADKGFKLGLCKGLQPWPGWTYTKLALIASGTKSPNAAKLFIRYVLTPEGIAPQAVDGKLSTNVDVGLPPDEPSGIAEVLDKLQPYEATTALEDWEARQDWQDFWQVNYRK